MIKVEDNKIQLEESFEEESFEETYKEKVLRLVKKPIFYIPVITSILLIVGYMFKTNIRSFSTTCRANLNLLYEIYGLINSDSIEVTDVPGEDDKNKTISTGFEALKGFLATPKKQQE